MSDVPEHIKAHRELEYLRSVGSLSKKDKKLTPRERAKKRKRIKERYQKLREVNYDD